MRRLAEPLVLACCVFALMLACFSAVLLRGEQFGYRDAAHFYYPLYQRVQMEWNAGRWPLWENEENGGMPLLGNPTAAVLYPGKLIYAALPYAWGARLYIIAHVALALATMYFMLRRWNVSRTGSGIAALSYAFGTPILFQYCNVIFLVGAAWTPLGLLAADRWVRERKLGGLALLAVVLALQTLGGDPQAAYVVGLCALGYGAGLAWANRSSAKHPRGSRAWTILGVAVLVVIWIALTLAAGAWLPRFRPPQKPDAPVSVLPWMPWAKWILLGAWGVASLAIYSTCRRGPAGKAFLAGAFGLIAAALLAGGLSAAQLVPVIEFTSQTMRAADDGPHDIYPFSLEPYRVAELVWPNLYGSSFQENHAWLSALPPAHVPKIWVPSLYIGGLSVILALGAFGFHHGPPHRAWMSAITLVALLASFGQFAGPLWLARCSPKLQRALGPPDPADTGAIRADGQLRDGDGSPYWLMATILPEFKPFRYPSKLLTFVSLGLAALAGLGWDRASQGNSRAILAWLAGLLVVGALGLAAAWFGQPQFLNWLSARSSTLHASAFGPFRPDLAWRGLIVSLIHGCVILAASGVVIVSARKRWAAAGPLALMLLTADLAWSNSRFVVSVPQAEFDARPKLLATIEEAAREDKAFGPYRVHRMPIWEPLGWLDRSQPARAREVVAWERDTLQPKYGVPHGLQYTLCEGTAELFDYMWFFSAFLGVTNPRISEALGLEPGQRPVVFSRRGFDLWNSRYFLVPNRPANTEFRSYVSFTRNTTLLAQSEQDDWRLYRNEDAYPRAWIVHQARVTDPIPGLNRASRMPKMIEILYQADEYWNLPGRVVYNPAQLAWVETDDKAAVRQGLSGYTTETSETAKVVSQTPQRIELEANLMSPGLVVLAEVFYPGWELAIDGKPAPIYRTNRMMRGALVPSGRHRLVFTYQPASFKIGAAISIASFVALAGLVSFASWSSRRSRLAANDIHKSRMPT